MATELLSFAELVLERVVESLGQYRQLVERGATGNPLEEHEADEVGRLLRELGLPAWCYPRDVRAWGVMKDTTSDHRRRELLWIYPHLFGEPRQWAELRRAERASRRRIMAQLREAVSVGK